MKVKCIDKGRSTILEVGKEYEVFEEIGDKYLVSTKLIGAILYLKKYFEIIKEDKMENILKVGDKVVCTDDGGMKFLTKDEVYTVDKLDGEYIYLSEIKSSFSFNSRLFEKVDSGKTEGTKVVRKWEDLIGMENGFGLTIDENLDVVRKGFHGYYLRKEELFTFEGYLGSIKCMGFKFDYKPLRSLEEVIEEMIAKTDNILKEDRDYDLYEVEFIKFTKHYKIRLAETVGAPVFVAGIAQKYADELNEIIGVGK